VGAGIAAGAGLGAAAAARPGGLPGLGGDNRQASVADRRSNLQSQLGQGQQMRTDRMQDRQGSRQDFMNNRREDWQDWAGDHHGHWGDWQHGCWHGNAGAWWDHMWDEHPGAMALGVTRWGLNRVGAWYGYGGYYSENPYYEESSGAPVDYSQPVVSDYSQALAETTNLQSDNPTPLPPGVTDGSVSQFDQARATFYEGKYAEALQQTDAVLKQLPSDAVVNEFRALCLFALKRYKESAAVLNAVLAVGPGWDWTTLSGMYPSVEAYTTQLRALESYAGANPNSADAAFVLGYHYLTGGHPDAARTQFAAAAKLQPKDAVSAYLAQSLSPPSETATPAAATTEAPTIPAEQLTGTWSATGAGNSKYVMTLNADGTFTWAYSKGPKKQTVKGVYAVQGSDIAMDVDAGGKMLATIALKGDGLNFLSAGAAKGDKGLDFTKGG
jgi:tetratricopeptide (TPR) repeat protein